MGDAVTGPHKQEVLDRHRSLQSASGNLLDIHRDVGERTPCRLVGRVRSVEMGPPSMSTSGKSMPDAPQLSWFSKDLIEILPAAVYVCDTEAVIVAFNQRATELWGRTPKVGQTDEKFCGSHKLFRPDGTYLPHPETPMGRVLRTGQSAPMRK